MLLGLSRLVLLIPLFGTQILFGQSFLNGGFETNTAGVDRINITNAAFNTYMSSNTGFGTWSGVGNLDIVRTTSYGLGPQSGTWYIALTGGGTDRVAMQLASPLVAGNTYTLNYYDNQWSTFTSPEVRVHVSTNNSTLGTFAFMGGAPISTSWTLRTNTFIAPISGNFICIETNGVASGGVWTKVDNFFFTVVLPVQSLVMGGERLKGTNTVEVRAELETDEPNLAYFLERGTDGGEFELVRQVFPELGNGGKYKLAETDELISFQHQDYRLKMVDANGGVHYSSPIQIETTASEPEFLVYPNPSNGLFNLFYRHPLVDDAVSIEVYDLQGKQILQKELDRTSPEQLLDLRGTAHGLYFLNIRSGGYQSTSRIIIQ